MAAEVVQDDDVARPERWGKDLLDVEDKELAVDGAVDHPRRVDTIMTQGGDEGQGLPVSVRRISLQPLSLRSQPRRGAMLVFTQVSSMNTRRQGSIRPW